jgi:LasA protease
METGPKTRSGVKRLWGGFVLLAWLGSVLACSQDSTVSLVELTAAAGGSPETMFVPPTRVPSEMVAVSQTAVGALPAATLEQNTPQPTSIPITATPAPSLTPVNATSQPLVYYVQAGDTLPALALRFDVNTEEITSQETIPPDHFMKPGQMLMIPDRANASGPPDILLPDSEVTFSPSTVDFDVSAFVDSAGGYLAGHEEYVGARWRSGAELVAMVASAYSINPRLLLAVIEYRSNWVYGDPQMEVDLEYPLGWEEPRKKGLYGQLVWVSQQLSVGYYGWRRGSITWLEFPDGGAVRLAPSLNAGSVALQYLFAQLYDAGGWYDAFYGSYSYPLLHESMFGNPWMRAQDVEPLFPTNLTQLPLELPFQPGHTWNFTGGPHSVWGVDSAMSALDFAPIGIRDCNETTEWVVAAAPGLVVRSENGLVIVDLDGDGYEQTGWSMLYLHIATDDRIPAGAFLDADSRIGHPSCEGGQSTGTHVHIARKYNGEWMLADGPVPFNLSGWEAQSGSEPYKGTLSKNDQIVRANMYSSFETTITRPYNQ